MKLVVGAVFADVKLHRSGVEIYPDDQLKLNEPMQRVVRERMEYETDYSVMHSDGAVRDIHSTGHPVFSPTVDRIEFMGAVIDVTDRKRAEEELRLFARNVILASPATVDVAYEA